MTDEHDDAVIRAAKKSGKTFLTSISKAGLRFTKRVAEGAFNAQMAQSQVEETTEKIKVVGSELGKAFIKGAIEGATESVSGVIKSVQVFSEEISKNEDSNDED